MKSKVAPPIARLVAALRLAVWVRTKVHLGAVTPFSVAGVLMPAILAIYLILRFASALVVLGIW